MENLNYENEIWRDIPEYEGLYQASNMGRVRSLDRNIIQSDGRVYHYKGKILYQGLTRGYLNVCLYKNSKGYPRYVARLVWSAFNGPIPEGMDVNHINEVKTDNSLSNLNLMTRKENNNWGTHNERMAKTLSKPVLQYTKDGKLIKEWESVIAITRELGFNRGNISSCCLNRKHFNTAHGFKWQYK